MRRLRERAEPVRLFGESDYDAYQRLKKLEILEPEVKVGGVMMYSDISVLLCCT